MHTFLVSGSPSYAPSNQIQCDLCIRFPLYRARLEYRVCSEYHYTPRVIDLYRGRRTISAIDRSLVKFYSSVHYAAIAARARRRVASVCSLAKIRRTRRPTDPNFISRAENKIRRLFYFILCAGNEVWIDRTSDEI